MIMYNFSEIDKKLIKACLNVKSNAYVPITKFKVGAAILADDGEIYTGTNIETMTLAPSICAERNAIYGAMAKGVRTFSKIAVCGDYDFTFPCGVCRQVIYELSPEATVFVVKSENEVQVYKIKDLLPHGFRLEEE